MSLSRPITNRGEISTFQLLLEISQSLLALTSDPKALEKAAKDAFSLSEAEESRALASRADIAKNEAILSEQRKSLADTEFTLGELQKEKSTIQSTLDTIKKEQSRLAKADADIGKRALDLSVKENDLKNRESTLETGKKKLLDDTATLNKRIADVANNEKALAEKAAKLRGLMDA